MLTGSQCRGGLSPIGKLSASERLPHPEADGVARAGKEGKKGGVRWRPRRGDENVEEEEEAGEKKPAVGSSGQ